MGVEAKYADGPGLPAEGTHARGLDLPDAREDQIVGLFAAQVTRLVRGQKLREWASRRWWVSGVPRPGPGPDPGDRLDDDGAVARRSFRLTRSGHRAEPDAGVRREQHDEPEDLAGHGRGHDASSRRCRRPSASGNRDATAAPLTDPVCDVQHRPDVGTLFRRMEQAKRGLFALRLLHHRKLLPEGYG